MTEPIDPFVDPRPRKPRAAKPDPVHQARVDHIRAWEAAWRDAHGGQEPPPEVIASMMAQTPAPPTAPAPPPAPWQAPPGSPYGATPPAGAPSYATGMYPPNAYPSYSPYPAGQPVGNDGMALTSMILGIAGLVTCCLVIPSILAIIFGHISLGRIKTTGAQGRGMALAGLITGYAYIGLGVVYVIFMSIWGSSGMYYSGY